MALPGFECGRGEGTFYAFPRVTGAMGHRSGRRRRGAGTERLLDNEADVALRPGLGVSARPGYVRLSYACSMQTLEEAVRRLQTRTLWLDFGQALTENPRPRRESRGFKGPRQTIPR